MTRAEARKQLVNVACELVASIRCHCDHCWTSRGMHDPQGCPWDEIADLRAAVNVYEATLSGGTDQ